MLVSKLLQAADGDVYFSIDGSFTYRNRDNVSSDDFSFLQEINGSLVRTSVCLRTEVLDSREAAQYLPVDPRQARNHLVAN